MFLPTSDAVTVLLDARMRHGERSRIPFIASLEYLREVCERTVPTSTRCPRRTETFARVQHSCMHRLRRLRPCSARRSGWGRPQPRSPTDGVRSTLLACSGSGPRLSSAPNHLPEIEMNRCAPARAARPQEQRRLQRPHPLFQRRSPYVIESPQTASRCRPNWRTGSAIRR